MRPSSPGRRRRDSRRLELLKAGSTFISSIIIASAGIYVTAQFNSQQLEISRNRDLSTLIPNLGSNDPTIRRFSAISLGLYGREAIPALIATLDDEKSEVRSAAVKALTVIGDPAKPELIIAFENQRNDVNLRAMSLLALGEMHEPRAYDFAINALGNPSEDPDVRKDAATVLGFFRREDALSVLLHTLDKSKDTDVTLSRNIVWALGVIKEPSVVPGLLAMLHHRDDGMRYQVVWALASVGDEKIVGILGQVELNDTSDYIRQAARDAKSWYMRSH